eukprot:GHVR01007293.1.p1 GENE.GHVR01007293.1~~GHVR01007293.1.p1  ORF type:complete len:214 (-),score=17.24 GHVR01007293.1:241-882(-)
MQTGRVLTALNEASFRAIDRPGVTDALLRTNNASLSAEIARLRLRVMELERTADTDPLVPVYNRRAFIREVSRAQTVMTRYGMMSSIIFLDLNGFKAINDSYGHAIGDALLKRFGQALLSGVRQCDMVARLGGDEFGVLLFKSTPDIARAKAASLSCRLQEERISTKDGYISLSAAWGVAACKPGYKAEEILHHADTAMYVAKRAVRDQVKVA